MDIAKWIVAFVAVYAFGGVFVDFVVTSYSENAHEQSTLAAAREIS